MAIASPSILEYALGIANRCQLPLINPILPRHKVRNKMIFYLLILFLKYKIYNWKKFNLIFVIYNKNMN